MYLFYVRIYSILRKIKYMYFYFDNDRIYCYFKYYSCICICIENIVLIKIFESMLKEIILNVLFVFFYLKNKI